MTTPSPSKSGEQFFPEDEIARSLAVAAYLFAKQAARFPATSVATANKRYDTQVIEGGVKIIRTLNMADASFNSMRWSDLQEKLGYKSSEAKSMQDMVNVTKQNSARAEQIASDLEAQVKNAEAGLIPVEQMPDVMDMKEKAASYRGQIEQSANVIAAYEAKLKPINDELAKMRAELEELMDKPKVPETKVWELKFADFPVLL